MRLLRAALVALAIVAPTPLWAQATLLQGGPWTPGHMPQYVGQGSSQPVVQDGGSAGGEAAIGGNPSELGITARGTGAPPFAGQGAGPFGANVCDYDAPITNPTGFHFICLSANIGGSEYLAIGSGGGAGSLPFRFNINGVDQAFSFTPSTAPSGEFANGIDAGGNLLYGTPASTPIAPSTAPAGQFTNGYASGVFSYAAPSAAMGLESVIVHGAVSNCQNGVGTCTDNSTAFNATVAAAQTNERNILVPCGDYYLSSGVLIVNNTDTNVTNFRPSLIGGFEGSARCVHLWFGPGNFNGITMEGTNGQNAGSVSMQTISGFTITKSDYQGYGVALLQLAHVHMHDVYSTQFQLGFYLQDVQESMFENLYAVFNALGGMQAIENTFSPPNAISCYGCSMSANGGFGYDFQNPSIVNINGGTIEANGYVGGAATWGIRLIYSGVTDVESNIAAGIDNVYFERNSGVADIFYVNGNSPAVPSALKLTGNNFNRGQNEIARAVTISIASPAVFTFPNHGFVVNQPVTFYSSGALPTGLVANNTYYVISAATNTFEVSATPGGSAVNTSGSQTGSQSVGSRTMNSVRLSTTGNSPMKLSMMGNAFGGLSRPGAVGVTYVPASVTPYVSVDDPTQPIQVCDLANRYTDYQEAPSFFQGCDYADVQMDEGASPTIRRLNNISGVTRNGQGDYTFNFSFPGLLNPAGSAPLPFAITTSSSTPGYAVLNSYTQSSARIQYYNVNNVLTDAFDLTLRVQD